LAFFGESPELLFEFGCLLFVIFAALNELLLYFVDSEIDLFDFILTLLVLNQTNLLDLIPSSFSFQPILLSFPCLLRLGLEHS